MYSFDSWLLFERVPRRIDLPNTAWTSVGFQGEIPVEKKVDLGCATALRRITAAWSDIGRKARPAEPGLRSTGVGVGKNRSSASARNHPVLISWLILSVLSGPVSVPAHAASIGTQIERLDRLERENRQLRKDVDALKAELAARRANGPPVENVGPPDTPQVSKAAAGSPGFATEIVKINSRFGYEILDPTTGINRKQRLILKRRKDGTLRPDTVHIQGAVAALANVQSSNRAGKFGYLMRHPTEKNQRGKTVSEATIHSAQLGLTGMLGDWITANVEILFDPEQSFGEGTNTDIRRNLLQVRRAYVLFGNPDRSPFYASIGKMAVPFGLGDTVNPFSASTVWHAFGGLANGATVGYADGRLAVSAMAVQGGAQFRAANTPVDGSAVPSRLNNFAVDASYLFGLSTDATLLFGASYLYGSAYCQDYPVQHFRPCRDNNPAFDIYGKLTVGNFTLKGEFARTLEEWPGTFNPEMPEFAASKVTSFDAGLRYRFTFDSGPLDISAEFSRFRAGPDGAPWERQDQIVFAAAWFPRPSVKLFGEYIRIDGYAPLNFISGGSIRDADGEVANDRTHSDRSARTDVLLLGVNAGF